MLVKSLAVMSPSPICWFWMDACYSWMKCVVFWRKPWEDEVSRRMLLMVSISKL